LFKKISEVKEEKMKSEKAKEKAMIFVICTVFLVAVSGVFVAASASEDISSDQAKRDYVSSAGTQDESFLNFDSSAGTQDENFLNFDSSAGTQDESFLNFDSSAGAQDENFLDFASSAGAQNESFLDFASSAGVQDENFLDFASSVGGLNEPPLKACVSGETTSCEIKYDDGRADDGLSWTKAWGCFAVHFTNTCPGTTLKTAKFYINSEPAEIEWEVLKWTGSEPGSVIVSGTTEPKRPGWHEVDVGVTVPKDFVIVLYQTVGSKPYIGIDFNSPIDDRGWYYDYYEGGWLKINELTEKPLDIMIRAVMDGSDPILSTVPEPPSHDFGSVPVNETRTWTFNIKNIGSGTLEWSVKKDQEWIGVSPNEGETKTETDHVAVKVDTYKMTPSETYIGNITVISTIGGTETGTIHLRTCGTEPEVSISTDKFKYCPDDTMRISVNITNPRVSDLLFEWYGVKVEREEGAPQFSLWMPIDNRTISGDKTIEEDVPIVDEGSEPFDIILYARLVDPGTGQVLAADSTCCVYSPTCG